MPGVCYVPGPGALGRESDQFIGLSFCLVGRTFPHVHWGTAF